MGQWSLLFAALAMTAWAMTGDLTHDNRVDMSDFALLAAAWQKTEPNLPGDINSDGTVDLADLVIVAEWWLYHAASPPVAAAVNTATVTYEPVLITLAASDDGRPKPPGKLKYVISSYPAAAQLQDPTVGAGLFYGRHVPWTLSSWGNQTLFWSTAAETYQFSYRADDGGSAPSGGAGEPATVTVSVAENPRNHLSFDGRGQVAFAAQNSYNIASGWAVHLYVRTQRPNGGLLQKRADSGAGWQIDLVSGRPVLRLWSAGGDASTLVYPDRIDTGVWHTIEAGVYPVDDPEDPFRFVFGMDGDTVSVQLAIDDPSAFSNNEPVLLGRTTGAGGFCGDVDKLRFFSAYSPLTIGGMIIEIGDEPKRQLAVESAVGFGVASAIRYMFDEGSGLLVTDNKQGLTGSMNDPNRVLWHPFIDPFVPVLP